MQIKGYIRILKKYFYSYKADRSTRSFFVQASYIKSSDQKIWQHCMLHMHYLTYCMLFSQGYYPQKKEAYLHTNLMKGSLRSLIRLFFPPFPPTLSRQSWNERQLNCVEVMSFVSTMSLPLKT